MFRYGEMGKISAELTFSSVNIPSAMYTLF